jgi:hypothetical protein
MKGDDGDVSNLVSDARRRTAARIGADPPARHRRLTWIDGSEPDDVRSSRDDLGARVLGEFGDDPIRFADAKFRKTYAGT